ncbi:hypothetical protein [Undibacterium crateris]|uniref:hypothetical protein n=1 Tax=Undibacterium crateris TaxID=2528175 RepID=UPI001389E02C|nr:hypothetical protein [Undibacterium crateris]NDI85121.1 hypothetical protein [Undibacterium crateris]
MTHVQQDAAAAKSTSELRTIAAQTQAPESRLDMFTLSGLQLAHKLAKTYASSNAVPSAFRDYVEKKDKSGTNLIENPNAIGNCIVAIETAESTGFSISAVMQNAHVIEGKLSWSAQFVIAAINASRRFTPLRFTLRSLGMISAKYKEKTTWNKDDGRYNMVDKSVDIENWECIAWAYPIENGHRVDEKIESIPVSMKMAVEEGWYAKNGSKWQTEMKFQMLQYRAATFFGRLNAPDVLMGFGQTTEELQDTVIDITPQPDGTHAANIEQLRKTAAAPAARTNQEDVTDVEAKELSRPAEATKEYSEPKINETSAQTKGATSSTDAANASNHDSPASPGADAQAADDYKYAMSLVEKGSLEEALDYARSMHPDDAEEIRTMVADKRQKAEQLATPARRTRSNTVDMGS